MSQESAVKREAHIARREAEATSPAFDACGKCCGKSCITCPHWFAQVDGEARHHVFDHLRSSVTVYEYRL